MTTKKTKITSTELPPDSDHLTHWLVVEQNYWGRGETLAKAFKTMREAGGKRNPRHFVVYRCTPECRIDSMGYICFTTREDHKPSYLKVQSTV